MKTVVGMFSDVNEAQRSFEDLMRFGVGANDISVVTHRRTSRAVDGLKLSSIDAKDAGPLAARGPVAAMLTRDPHRLLSSLEDAGVSSQLAEQYVAAVREGETLEFVMVEDRNAERVVEIMRRHAAGYDATGESNGTGLASAVSQAQPGSSATHEAGPRESAERAPLVDKAPFREDGQIIPILREELQVGKREIERGAVHVGVRVTERPVSEHITLREEHVEIERRPVDRAPLPDEIAFQNSEIDLIEHGEEVVVSKQARVVEEVRLHTRVDEHDETINANLRSTEVEVDRPSGDRSAYASHLASVDRNASFAEAEPAYQFGRTLVGSPNEQWTDIESNARASWETKHPGTWERFKNAIHYAWSRARST